MRAEVLSARVRVRVRVFPPFPSTLNKGGRVGGKRQRETEEGVGDSWLEKRVARNGGKMCN